MTPEFIAFLQGKLMTASTQYSESLTLQQQLGNEYSRVIVNQQIKDVVIVPSSSEEVLSQILSSSAALRGAQPPIAPPVA